MKWFRKRSSEGSGSGAPREVVSELLDPYHQRASVRDAVRIMVEPGQVLDNIAAAMERVDLDIDTAISVEDDVASVEELGTMINALMMGPTLAVHVVNNAVRIMDPRYPAELVRRPLPPDYDLRKIYPVSFADAEHETAKAIFNRRLASDIDLEEHDVFDDLDSLDDGGQLQVFLALFFMFGSKVGAIKNRTGIE